MRYSLLSGVHVANCDAVFRNKLFFGCVVSMCDSRVDSFLMWCSERSSFLPSEKRSVQCCEEVIGHCHETVISADAQRPVTRDDGGFPGGFSDLGRIPKPSRIPCKA